MTGPDGDPPIEGQLLEEAATWFARMRGPEAEASRARFEAWLARGALHRRAYNRASEIFAMGKLLAGEADAEPDAAQRPERRRRRTIVLACAALLLLCAGGFLLRPLANAPGGPQTASNSGTKPSADQF